MTELRFYILSVICLVFSAGIFAQEETEKRKGAIEKKIFLVVLGTVQDAGSPHIACKKECCSSLFENQDYSRKVVSLGLVDQINQSSYLFEATPDLPTQMKALRAFGHLNSKETPDGIFLTHAHIGHYTGLMYLGKEAMNSDQVNVFTMPKMKGFLETNGPWGQLVSNRNIILQSLKHGKELEINKNIRVTPLKVPHRDEYSETVGYLIKGPKKTALFLPDIDKWEKWETEIVGMIKKVDYAFIDATFFDAEEINNRDISEIPHPFIVESMERFKHLSDDEKNRVIFIHFNHTNPVLKPDSKASGTVLKKGFRIARRNDIFDL